MSKDTNGYMGVYAYAREKKVTVDWVYKLIQSGKLPAKKIGRKWQIEKKTGKP
jgi:excisionase family DNA binding protein